MTCYPPHQFIILGKAPSRGSHKGKGELKQLLLALGPMFPAMGPCSPFAATLDGWIYSPRDAIAILQLFPCSAAVRSSRAGDPPGQLVVGLDTL